jgi:hypothetical protein
MQLTRCELACHYIQDDLKGQAVGYRQILQDRQCRYNVTFRHVCVTIVAEEKK